MDNEKWVQKYKTERKDKAESVYQILKSNDQKNSDPKILDIGCFEGKMIEQFVTHSNNLIIGIEVSFEALKIANKNLKKKNIGFIVADAKNLPLKENTFDWIVCSQVIDCLENKIGTVQEFDRVLKSNGLVYLSTASNLFLKLYKRFPRVFIPYVGPYYGRFMTDFKSGFISPMNYKFWKKTVLEKTKLKINDITPKVILEKKKIKKYKMLIDILYFIFSNWSPTWIFILYRNNKSEKL